jgi:hypothetical protein
MSLALEQAILRVIATVNRIGQKRVHREAVYQLRIAWEMEYGPLNPEMLKDAGRAAGKAAAG